MPLDRGTNIYTDPEENLGSIPYSETPRSVIERLYTSILGRQPDEAGLDYWTSVLASGEPLSNIANYFQGSTELAPMFQGGFDVNNDKNISTEERQAYLNSLLAAQDTPAGSDVLDLIGGTDTKTAVDTTAGAGVLDLIGGTDTPASDTRTGDTRLASEDVISDPTLVARTYNGVVYDTVAEADAARAAAAGRSGDTRLGGEDTPAGGGGNSTVGGGGNSTVGGGGNSTVGGGGNSTVGGGAYTPRGLSALTPLPTSTVTSRDVITSFQPERAPAKLAGPMAAPSTLRRAGDQPYYNMYQEVLGRIPEAEALAYWKSQFGDKIDPTELTAFKTAAQGELNAKQTAAQAELAAKNAPPPAYTGPSLTYASQGFNAPVASGLSQALSSGMTKDQYLANVKNYLDSGVVPGQILSDMTKYGITTDDLIGAKYASTLASTDTSTGGAGAGGAPPPGGTSEPVQGGKTGGAVIRFAEGGEPMTKYTLPDFGLTPATSKGVFNYERDVVFNPEFAKLEAIERARLANDPREQARLERDRLMKFGLITSPAEEIASRYWEATRGMKEGGVAKGLGSIAMKGYAEEMAQKGRFGDTMLAHISPEEAQMLQAAGGAGTINPHTGLPEYFSWRKLLKKLAPIVQFAAPFIPGIGPLAAAAISGVAGGFSGPGGFNFKRGLMSGLMSYGMGQMARGIEAAGQVGQAPVTTPDVAGSEINRLANTIPSPEVSVSDFSPEVNTQPTPTTYAPISQASQPITPSIGDYFSKGADRLNQLYTGASNLATNVPGAYDAAKQAMGMTFGQAGTAAGTGALGIMGENERLKYLEEQKAKGLLKAEEEEEYKQLFLRTLGRVYAGGGGISALAAGGASGPPNQPRTINGAGDGMSDSVPATIEGIQEARLADGEFVIPADVVADLGNGSSNAGSKKLYAMMDRVRDARHGTTKQPPEINMGRLMPA